jgi:hypothetical protein
VKWPNMLLFSNPKYSSQRNGERLLSLVLVPALFFGTLPQAACICADGHREEYCQAMACRISPAEPQKAEKCGCCQNRSARSDAKNCCQAKQRQSGSSTGLVVATDSCCNPIIKAPAPIASSGKVELATKSVLATTIEPENWFQSPSNFQPALGNNPLSKPPPIDVIIVYLHLTI